MCTSFLLSVGVTMGTKEKQVHPQEEEGGVGRVKGVCSKGKTRMGKGKSRDRSPRHPLLPAKYLAVSEKEEWPFYK